MSELRSVNDLIVQGRYLVEDPEKAHVSIGEWIDWARDKKDELHAVQKVKISEFLMKLYERLNEDLAA